MVSHIRAALFVPAHRPDRFAKAAASGADAVILDLEDAVPSDAKAEARAQLTCSFTQLPVIVRINAAGTPWHQADLETVSGISLAAVMVPKAEEPASVASIAAAMGGRAQVIALIESARGLANARAIAALDNVVRLAFGSIDFCADLGMAHLREALIPTRTELVLASRLAGIAAPLDGVTARFDDPEAARDDALHARTLGMTGKLCIHPGQVEVVTEAFRPTQAELNWAKRVLATGDGAVTLDGEMVDEPVRLRARAILSANGNLT
jgi:citrate lyase subunit beta / citryl-CoA lyase